jgi:hypothetical protein
MCLRFYPEEPRNCPICVAHCTRSVTRRASDVSPGQQVTITLNSDRGSIVPGHGAAAGEHVMVLAPGQSTGRRRAGRHSTIARVLLYIRSILFNIESDCSIYGWADRRKRRAFPPRAARSPDLHPVRRSNGDCRDGAGREVWVNLRIRLLRPGAERVVWCRDRPPEAEVGTTS